MHARALSLSHPYYEYMLTTVVRGCNSDDVITSYVNIRTYIL